MAPVFFHSLRQLSGRWRILLILFLAALPMALTALVAATLGDETSFDKDFTNTLIDGLLIAAVMPIVTMVLATASFGNELGDRTLSFLVLRPIPRAQIVLPKLLAGIVVGGPPLIASGVVSTLLGLEAAGRQVLLPERPCWLEWWPMAPFSPGRAFSLVVPWPSPWCMSFCGKG